MIDGWQAVLTLVAAVGCALMGGVFFAFSFGVMNALARLPAAQGIAAMQSINVAVINPVFLGALVGTAIACGAVAVVTLVTWPGSAAVYLLVGCGLYLVGVILLTGTYHLPRNNALATVDPGSADAESRWARYLAEWTRWNHVRATAGLGAAALLIVGLRVG